MILLSWMTILICWILKFLGFKEFEIPIINILEPNIYIKSIINCILFVINGVCHSLILIKRKLKLKEFIFVLVLCIFDFVLTYNISNALLCTLVDFSVFTGIGLLCIKDKWYKILLEVFIISMIFILYQGITLSYKNIFHTAISMNIGFYESKILQIDFYILLMLTVLHNFKEGGYIYGRWWQRFLVVLSNKRRNEKSISRNQKVIQEDVENEFGYKLFALFIAIFQFALVWTLCYFINNTTWQFIVVFITFIVMRLCFGKSYHCKHIITCTALSCITFVATTRLSLPSYISVLCNVLNGTLLAYIMYMVYYYHKYTTAQGITLCVGTSIETFQQAVDKSLLSEIDYSILKYYYVDRKSILQIARIVGYSTESIKKHKAQALKDLGFS